MRDSDDGTRLFLLSPATMSGERARQLSSPEARFETARLLRSPEGVPIGEAFSFCSSLYFRGKIAYARRFAAPPAGIEEGALVIAPGFGLVPTDWALTLDRLEALRRTPVDPEVPGYAKPLRDQARALRERLSPGTRVVLLGSIATGKYVDLLEPVFAERLVFPRCFVGQGDMRRGSLMLNAARAGEELEYATLDIPRHARRVSSRKKSSS